MTWIILSFITPTFCCGFMEAFKLFGLAPGLKSPSLSFSKHNFGWVTISSVYVILVSWVLAITGSIWKPIKFITSRILAILK